MIGEEQPHTGLKHKVKRINFASNVEIIDPVTAETVKEPIKPFMVNQLVLSFERDRMILSKYDEVLHKQLVDYEVVKIGANGKPVYSSDNEHFLDALGLAHLAFVQQFKELVGTIKDLEVSSKIGFSSKRITGDNVNALMSSVKSSYSNKRAQLPYSDDSRADRQTWVKVSPSYRSSGSSNSWGSRGGSGGFGRSSW